MTLVIEPVATESQNTADGPRYFNRELSWLEFNGRVLEEAMDERHPLLERVKFLAIFSTNLDEFFMIRVAGIREQINAGVSTRSADEKTPSEQLIAIRQRVCILLEQMRHYWVEQLEPQLYSEGVMLIDYVNLLPEQQACCTDFFEREIFPVLTPLAVDPGHPFPHISNLSLNLAVVIRDPENGDLFARVKVPAVLPRLIPLPRNAGERRDAFIWIEQVIAANIGRLFPGMEVLATYPFRIIRDADMEIQEDEAADLLRTIEASVRQRRFGAAVSLFIRSDTPPLVRDLLIDNLKLTQTDLYEVDGTLGFSDLMALMKIDRPELKDPPFYPTAPTVLRQAHTSAEMFAAIRQQDILLHHPYDSFQPLVTLIEAAAEDPDVLAIKQTLYRVGGNSPIVEALMRAREQDKQVTVLVELKARFDEENNITWARALERVGVHVVYGLVGLKTHAKLAMVVRRDPDGLRRYLHLGTGNYNASTARIYTDLGLLTCRPDIAADVSEVFNTLTGYARQQAYRKLLVAPNSLRSGLEERIEREIAHAQAGRPAQLIFKLNALVDERMIDLLYRASQSGVQIDLIIRGMCCLRPSVPGLSENITVRSIVGRFLEHSRVFFFSNGGASEIYVGSADLMTRNLDRRVETLFPIEEPALVAQIAKFLDVYLQDTIRARLLQSDGFYHRIMPEGDALPIDSQAYFLSERLSVIA
ncbi:MAG: polyphosphate kinase 1 [Roseiflexaceae bacterium]|nr:polyphosphate kinase 1 [Roseiflexaceae bacterium]